ncbi:Endonuclease/Exonuclease/phosphatase family, partial [Carpediemonas membranifera]
MARSGAKQTSGRRNVSWRRLSNCFLDYQVDMIDTPGASEGHAQRIKVLSWNVLACKFLFGHKRAPQFEDFRDPAYRLPQIARVITEINPDVICLQEVDGQIETYFKRTRFFATHGYNFKWTRKQTETGERLNSHPDGCLTAWRTDRFALLGMRVVGMDTLAGLHHPARLAVDHAQVDIKQHNVAAILTLVPHTLAPETTAPPVPTVTAVRGMFAGLTVEEEDPGDGPEQPDEPEQGTPFVVVNTHVYWKPTFDWLKQAQAREVVRALSEVCAEVGTGRAVVAGDMNSVPGSGVYDVFLDGGLASAYGSYQALAPVDTPVSQRDAFADGEIHQARPRAAA